MIGRLTIICATFWIITGCEKTLVGPAPENAPESTFKVLWTILDEKYALFPLKHLNWDSLYTLYSSQLDQSTTEDKLWNVCGSLISELNDGHVSLFNREYTKSYWSSDIDPAKAEGFSLELIKEKYLEDTQITGEGYITWGTLNNGNTGYINIATFLGTANGRDWITDIDQVNSALSGKDALIIDLRNNGGGFAKNDLYFASSYIDSEITYYYSQLKTGPGHYDLNERTPKTIQPLNEHPYAGRIILLTNRFSSSGAEVATLILNYLPETVQIGDTTTGCFGEVTQVGQLPNGWTFNFPCTLTTLEDGSSPEGTGIAPDIFIDNTATDVANKTDNVLEGAISYINSR